MTQCGLIGIAIIFIASAVDVCLMCNVFGNLTAEIHPKVGKPFMTIISGCIEPSRFSDIPDLQVEQVKLLDQPITKFKKGTVQNLARLKYAVFNNTFTESIEPEAFRHLPRLAGLFLIHSRVKILQNNVFQNLPSLNKVRLHHNEVSIIEDYAFANIPTLRYVFLGNNQIEQWNGKWFVNSTALEEIDFQKNAITKIPPNAFQGMRNLSKIVLDYNKISEIESNAFQDVEHLEYLSLKYNCLKTLPPNIFPPNISIDSLHIDSNMLNYLENDVLNKISLREISMFGNPWKCPCLQRTLFWFYQSQGTSKLCGGCTENQNGNPVCIYPTVFASTCLDVIDEESTKTYFTLISNTDIISKCELKK